MFKEHFKSSWYRDLLKIELILYHGVIKKLCEKDSVPRDIHGNMVAALGDASVQKTQFERG